MFYVDIARSNGKEKCWITSSEKIYKKKCSKLVIVIISALYLRLKLSNTQTTSTFYGSQSLHRQNSSGINRTIPTNTLIIS